MHHPSRRIDADLVLLLIYSCVSVIVLWPLGVCTLVAAEAGDGAVADPGHHHQPGSGGAVADFPAFTSLTPWHQQDPANPTSTTERPVQIHIPATHTKSDRPTYLGPTDQSPDDPASSEFEKIKPSSVIGAERLAATLNDHLVTSTLVTANEDDVNTEKLSLDSLDPNNSVTSEFERTLHPKYRNSHSSRETICTITSCVTSVDQHHIDPGARITYQPTTSITEHRLNNADSIRSRSGQAVRPQLTVTTSVTTSSSTRIFPRASSSSSSSDRKQHRKQTGFQDILTGLVKLLGGKNVHIANNGESTGESSDVLAVASSRLNHRAPARVTYANPNPQQSVIATAATAVTALPTTTTTSTSNTTTTSIVQSTPVSIQGSEPNLPTNQITTTSTLDAAGKFPTGPITEWIPAYGAGNRPSISTDVPVAPTTTTDITQHASGTTHPAPIVVPYSSSPTQNRFTPTQTKTSATASKSSSSSAANTNQPQTEISYADILPTKIGETKIEVRQTSQSETTATKTEADHPGVVTPPTIPPSDVPGHEEPSAGIVLPVAKPTRLQPHDIRPTRTEQPHAGMVNTGQPAGSPFVIPVDIQQIRLGEGEADPVPDHHPVSPYGGHAGEQHQGVYIDGRKTYFDLVPTQTSAGGGDTTLVNVGFGYSFPTGASTDGGGGGAQPASQGSVSNVRLPHQHQLTPRPVAGHQAHITPAKNPQVINKTPVRIDTCIIGDESACNVKLNETCRVEAGVSSCNCRLGYGRDGLEQGCKPVVSLVVYIKVDRVNNEAITFGPEYQYSGSEKYQILEFESKNAVDSAFSLSAFAESYAGCTINSFFSVGGRVIINTTAHLLESPQTRSPTIKQELKRSLIAVIQQQNQNIGQSRLYVNGPLNPIPGVQDLDECADPNLNDCSKHATCANTFGSYKCTCSEGFLDKYLDEPRRNGRICAVCSPQYCNNRGDCITTNGQKECRCHGNYMGAKCETDGEVLGVALGASLAALVIIVLTLVCLCMWSRRWKRDQQKILGRPSGGAGSNYSYFNKASAQGSDFHLPVEDRIRWPQTNDSLDNFYAQPEPIGSGHASRLYPTAPRPPLPTSPPPQSSAHKTIQALRSLPLTGSRSNIMDDTDEDEHEHGYDTNSSRFHFPRPKSRISHSGHNNIYYDVTYSNNHEQQPYSYDKDYGNVNAFPLRSMRPYPS